MMLTLHFYRVYPVINSSMGDIGGKEPSRPFRSGILLVGNNWRFTSKFLSLFVPRGGEGREGEGRKMSPCTLDKNTVVLTSPLGGMRTILTGRGEGRGGGVHTRVQSTLGCIEAYSFESAGPILDTCLQIVEDIFLASGKFFSSISVSLAHSLSLILPFTKGTEFLSRMYTLTFATFLLYVHVYTMKRFLARLSVSS